MSHRGEKRDNAAKIAAAERDIDEENDSDDEMTEQQPKSSNQWTRSKTDRSEWIKSPTMMLLNAIASNSTID